MFKKIVLSLLLLCLPFALGASLGTRNDNEMGKFVLNGSNEICVRVKITDGVNVGDEDITNVGDIALDSISSDGTTITIDTKPEVEVKGDNANVDLLQLVNTDEGTTGQVGAKGTIEFAAMETHDDGTAYTQVTLAEIVAGKDSDYFSADTADVDEDGNLAFNVAVNGTATEVVEFGSDLKATFAGAIDAATAGNVMMARKFTIGHADLTDADTSEDEALFTLAAGGMIVDVYAYVTTQFTGGGNSAVTVAVGTTDADLLAEEHDVLGCGDTTWILEGQTGTDKGDGLFSTYRINYVVTTNTDIIAEFTTTDGTAAGLTAGSMDIYVVYLQAQ